MKNIITILCCCFFSLTLSSQIYLPIPTSEQYWIWQSTGNAPASYSRSTYGEDSVLLDMKYYFPSLTSYSSDGSDAQISGYFRQADGKLYKKIEGDTNEELILDMNMVVGDTLDRETFSGNKLVVTAVDTISYLDDVPRKRIEIQCEDNPDSFGSIFWVEGIGRLHTGEPCVLDGGENYLRCVLKSDDLKIYSAGNENMACWLETSVSERPDISFTVFPNPASTFLEIEIDEPIDQWQIYDVAGRVVKTGSSENMVDLADLFSGLYLIEVFTSQGIGVDSFVKL